MPFDPIKEERKKHKFYKNNPFFTNEGNLLLYGN